jgi:hypothetical protein
MQTFFKLGTLSEYVYTKIIAIKMLISLKNGVGLYSLLTQLIEAQLNELNTNISKKYPYSFVIKGKPSP